MKKSPPQSDEWLVIVNPNAGVGLGGKEWHKIESMLRTNHFNFSSSFTQAKGHAIHIAKEGIIDGYRNFIVVGGDGTMNEVLNGCFHQNTCPTNMLNLSMITVGTGNDWGRMFKIPADYHDAVQVIREKKTCLQDTGVVYFHNAGKKDKRYFINIAGLGFDAMVVKRTNRQKEKGRSGKAIYLWNLLISLLSYKHTVAEIVIDGNRVCHKVFTLSLGIGRYSGGGMMQTPQALPDDGLFDITVIKKMSKADVVRSLGLLYNGMILSHPKVEGYKGKDILIDSEPLMHLEVDGESLGHSPIKFEIIPRSINVVHNLKVSEN